MARIKLNDVREIRLNSAVSIQRLLELMGGLKKKYDADVRFTLNADGSGCISVNTDGSLWERQYSWSYTTETPPTWPICIGIG